MSCCSREVCWKWGKTKQAGSHFWLWPSFELQVEGSDSKHLRINISMWSLLSPQDPERARVWLLCQRRGPLIAATVVERLLLLASGYCSATLPEYFHPGRLLTFSSTTFQRKACTVYSSAFIWQLQLQDDHIWVKNHVGVCWWRNGASGTGSLFELLQIFYCTHTL